MARRPRGDLPSEGVYHLCARGVEQRTIFLDIADRLLFLALVAHASRRNDWEILAYCLMTNHFHLVVQARLVEVSGGMHLLNGRYAQAFNHRYERHGHLFQGRFYAGYVEDDDAVAHVCDYVLDNPIRAGICRARDEWRWLGGSRYALDA
jgi:REP element-mobilizing transposase RayT